MTGSTSSLRILSTDNAATDARLHRLIIRLKETVVDYSTATSNLRLLLVLKGHIQAFQGGQLSPVTLGEKQLAIMPPNTTWSGNWKGSVDCMLLDIAPSVLFEHANGPIQPQGTHSIQIVNDERLRHLLTILQQTLSGTPVVDDMLALYLSRLIVRHYLRRYCGNRLNRLKTGAGLTRRQLDPIAVFINEKIRDGVSLDELAGVVDMNGAAFCKRFKRTVGVSPYQYILRTRVGQAKEKLHESGGNLCDIAMSLGFYDQSQFTNTFRRLVGVSPRTYRKQINY